MTEKSFIHENSIELAEIDRVYREFYDFVSKTQDIDKRLDSFKNYRSYHFKNLHYIKANLCKGGRNIRAVLNVGCCGTPYPSLFDLNTVDYTMVDISWFSLERMKEIYPNDRIRCVVDDICNLSQIEDGSVDLILVTQVFEHIPQPEQALVAAA